MQAIILAAGMGKRLGEYTKEDKKKIEGSYHRCSTILQQRK